LAAKRAFFSRHLKMTAKTIFLHKKKREHPNQSFVLLNKGYHAKRQRISTILMTRGLLHENRGNS